MLGEAAPLLGVRSAGVELIAYYSLEMCWPELQQANKDRGRFLDFKFCEASGGSERRAAAFYVLL